jgi:RNA polymerase sigma-32 factor
MASPKGAAIAKDGDGLRRYLQQIQNLPMLGAQEELELSRRWRKDQDDNAAKQLVASHLRLVAKIAFRYRGYGLPLSDLISEGNVGMMHAVRRFDPEFGFRLASYARWWVRAAIQAYILHSWSLVKIATTAAQKRLFFNLRRLESSMQIIHDGDLLPEQVARVASVLGVSQETVISMHRRLAGRDRSLNAPVYPDHKFAWEDSLIDTNDLESVLAQQEEVGMQRAMLPVALGTLDQRQRHILIERRLKERPTKLEELASHYGVSAERVRQIESRAFEKLRKAMLVRIPPINESKGEYQARCRDRTAQRSDDLGV